MYIYIYIYILYIQQKEKIHLLISHVTHYKEAKLTALAVTKFMKSGTYDLICNP